jgi:hypothetical protein
MPSPRSWSARRYVFGAAVAAVALGAALAHAADSGTGGSGGMSVNPALIEAPATPGTPDSIVVANTTKGTLKVTVRARPWAQSVTGAVTPDRDKSLEPTLLVSLPSFSLGAGASQGVTLTLLAAPPNGSLYGSIEVIGVPVGASKHKGVSVGYRLISSLRLDPPAAARKFKVTVGTPQVQSGNVVLPVRNTGNTIEPVSGSARLSSSLGSRTGAIAAKRIVPGATVLLTLAPVKGLPHGHYTAAYTLTQSGHVVSKATGKFILG